MCILESRQRSKGTWVCVRNVDRPAPSCCLRTDAEALLDTTRNHEHIIDQRISSLDGLVCNPRFEPQRDTDKVRIDSFEEHALRICKSSSAVVVSSIVNSCQSVVCH